LAINLLVSETLPERDNWIKHRDTADIHGHVAETSRYSTAQTAAFNFRHYFLGAIRC
jgi:hypothetical protein